MLCIYTNKSVDKQVEPVSAVFPPPSIFVIHHHPF